MLLLGSGGAGGWWAWREGWLVEARNKVDAIGLAIVGAVTPFKLVDVTVEGRDYVERSAILGALGVKAGDLLLGIDLQASRRRLEAIDWVASATVERRLPDTLYVVLVERRAVAIWQNGDEYTLIDRDGRTVRASRMPPGAEKLLLLGGPGAPEHVGELLLLLAYEPAVAQRELRSAVGRPAPLEPGAEQRRRDLAARGGCGRRPPAAGQARRQTQIALARIRRRRSTIAGQALSQETRTRRCDARTGVKCSVNL